MKKLLMNIIHISFSLKIKEFKDSLIKISSTKDDSDISETEVYSYINGDWVNILFNNSLYFKYYGKSYFRNDNKWRKAITFGSLLDGKVNGDNLIDIINLYISKKLNFHNDEMYVYDRIRVNDMSEIDHLDDLVYHKDLKNVNDIDKNRSNKLLFDLAFNMSTTYYIDYRFYLDGYMRDMMMDLIDNKNAAIRRSKKLEEFLDYYKYLKESYLIKRELINGDVCNDRQLLEYLDYMRHALSIRESGIKLPLFSKNVMLMMENGFSIRNDEYCEDFETSNYKLKYTYSKTTMNHVFGGEYNEPLNLGKYTISLPQCEIDFINEGYELNHCASTYYDIVCDREALVFFLRDSSKPEEPLYTIETDTKFTRIIQVSGKFNVDLNPYTDEPACLALVDFCKRFFLDFSNLKYFDKFLDKK